MNTIIASILNSIHSSLMNVLKFLANSFFLRTSDVTYNQIQKKGTASQVDSHEYGPAEKAIDGTYDSTWNEDDEYVNCQLI